MADMDQASVSRSTCPDRSPKDCRSHDWKTRCAWTHKLMSARHIVQSAPILHVLSSRRGLQSPCLRINEHLPLSSASSSLTSLVKAFVNMHPFRQADHPARHRLASGDIFIPRWLRIVEQDVRNTRIPSECERERSTTLTHPELGILETDLSFITGTICTTKRRPKDRGKCNPHTQPAAEPRLQQALSTR